MKKTLLPVLLLSNILFAQQSIEEKKQAIANTKAQIEALQASLKQLEDSLPKKVKEEQFQTLKKAQENKLKVHAELGYVNNKGNTDTQSMIIDTKVKKGWDRHALSFSLDSEYASKNGEDTKNKYLAELEYNYKLCNKFYFEYLNGYKYDEFSGYDYRIYSGPGLKYELIDTEKHNLIGGGNILYSRDKAKESHEIDDYYSFRAKGDYTWQILENLKFKETLTYQTEIANLKHFFIYSKTALVSKINSIFSVSLSYKVDYVNIPEDDSKRSDRTMSANLIADF